MFKIPPLYLVTGSRFDPRERHEDTIASALRGGVKIVQLREKHLDDYELLAFAKRFRKLTKMYNALLIIDDRPDIAKLCKADGVHIGQEDLSVRDVKEIMGQEVIVGKSTHSIKQAIAAENEGADYIGVGPVFPTDSKKGVCAPVGIDLVREVTEKINIPFVAIGGIKHTNLEQVIQAGAKSVACITGIVSANDPYQATRGYLDKMEKLLTV